MFEAWALEAAALGRSEKTVKEYRSLIQRFIAFLGHDDALRSLRWTLWDGRLSA